MVKILLFTTIILITSCGTTKYNIPIKQSSIVKSVDNCNKWKDLKIGEDKEKIENIMGSPHSYELVDLFYRCFYNDGTIEYTHNNNVISINSPKCNLNISKMDSFKQKACKSWSIIKSGMSYSEVIKILGESNGSQNYGYSTIYFYGNNSITFNNSNIVISVYGPKCYK
jgi:outer membrane protein assembly factor BamE (lipoprotein component of BamABCDE complex)